MKALSFDPSKQLDLYFRTLRDSSRDFIFLNVDGSNFDLTNYVISVVIKRFKNRTILEKTLSITDNTATWAIDVDESNVRVETYYWEMNVTLPSGDIETWLSGKCVFHDGIFDGVTSDSNVLTITTDGSPIYITVDTSSVASEAGTIVFKGFYDASTNVLPSGSSKGNMWITNSEGELLGLFYPIGTRIISLVDNADPNTESNWTLF